MRKGGLLYKMLYVATYAADLGLVSSSPFGLQA